MRRAALTGKGRALASIAAGALALAGCIVPVDGASQIVHVGTASGAVAEFEPKTISAPSRTRLALVFANASTLDHNLVFVSPLTARTREIVPPGASEVIQLDTPASGTFRFVCTIHEGMEGELVVR